MLTVHLEAYNIFLSAIWVSLMFTYLLGDVLRIFSGDIHKYKEEMEHMNQVTWMVAAITMLIPIVMILLSLVLPHELNQGLNILAALFLILFNLAGLGSYKSYYDRFLIVFGLGLNVLTITYASGWLA